MRLRLALAASAALLSAACAAPAPPPPVVPPPSAAQPAGDDAYARLSDGDVRLAAATLARALEGNRDGQRSAWRNEVGGSAGSVTPLRTYVSSNGYFCRSYEEELRHAAGVERFRHEACRSEAGAWVWL